jgi:two-component system, NarL family, sensor kinase
MSRQRSAWTVVLIVLDVALVIAAAVYTALTGRGSLDVAFIASLIAVATWIVGGAVVALARPDLPFGPLLLFGATCLAMSGALTAAAGAVGEDQQTLQTWLGWVGAWTFFPHLATLVLVYLLFPTGKVASSRWYPAVWLTILATAGGTVATAFEPGSLAESGPLADVQNPLGVDWMAPAVPAFIFLTVVALIASLVSLGLRIRRLPAEQRGSARLVFWLGVLDVPVGILAAVPPGPWVFLLTVPLTMTLTAAIVGTCLFGPLWDVRATIGRVLAYAALTAILAGVFALAVAVSASALGDGVVGLWIAAVVVAIGLIPAYRLLRRGVDRLLYGDRAQPLVAATAFGDALESIGEPDAALRRLCELAVPALKVPFVGFELPESGLVASAGSHTDPDRVDRIAVRYEDRQQGMLLIGLRSGEQRFSAQDRVLIDTLARQSAAAAHSLATTAAIRAHGAELIAVRERERDRLRRDLHDGVASRITGLTMGVEVAADVAPADPERTQAILRHTRSELATALDEVRRMIDDLGPASTADLGLGRALASLADRFSTDRIRVHARIDPGLDGVSPAVGDAAYFIASEAVTNAVRHAAAAEIDLQATASDGRIEITVTDDGVGLSPEHSRGVGIASMRARAMEHRGALDLTAVRPHGTRLNALLLDADEDG